MCFKILPILMIYFSYQQLLKGTLCMTKLAKSVSTTWSDGVSLGIKF